MKYEVVIGLEVHAQLLSKTKLFCSCSTGFGDSPNSNTCPVCLGYPGALPVLNDKAVELATRAALYVGCDVQPVSQWSRKNYFYPDLPKGYQISQFDQPIALGGELNFEVNGRPVKVGITRIHMEEDAGKNIHDSLAAGNRSFVDYNRGGVPLIEIVSEPDLRSGEDAAEYVRTLRQILRYLDVCDGNLEEGSLRCDANISLRPVGQEEFGTRAEIKNINSFRFVQQAIEYEIERQTEVLEGGGKVIQETRLWDTQAKATRSMRSKEEAHDYRYFPEPDLPDLVLAEGFVEKVRETIPEMPKEKHARYTSELGLSDYDAKILVGEPAIAKFYETGLKRHNNPKSIANWVINELLRELHGRSIDDVPFGGTELAEMVALIDEGVISGKIAKDVFAEMIKNGGSPSAIVEAKGLKQVSDTGALEAAVQKVLDANPDAVEKYKNGKTNITGFLVGQIMKETRGKANPKMVNELLTKKLPEPAVE